MSYWDLLHAQIFYCCRFGVLDCTIADLLGTARAKTEDSNQFTQIEERQVWQSNEFSQQVIHRYKKFMSVNANKYVNSQVPYGNIAFNRNFLFLLQTGFENSKIYIVI
jgi:hypothetical protein